MVRTTLLALCLTVGPVAAASPRAILGSRGTRHGDQHEGDNNATQIDHDRFPEIFRPCQVLFKDSRPHSSSMAPSISTDRLMPSTVRTTLAGKASLPLSLPPLTAARTACSISRCEVMPTFLRNLRTLTFSTSSFMFAS